MVAVAVAMAAAVVQPAKTSTVAVMTWQPVDTAITEKRPLVVL